MADSDLGGLMPIRDPRLRVIEFDYDVSGFMPGRTVAELPVLPTQRRSYIVAFGRSDGGRREPLLVDGVTAGILALSDGTRTAADIAEELNLPATGQGRAENLKWIEDLSVQGLISLRDESVGYVRSDKAVEQIVRPS